MAQLPKNIDVSKLRYSEIKTLSSGAKTVYVNYGTDKLTIQTPVLSLPPYGLSEPYDISQAKKKGLPIPEKDKKYDLDVSFKGIDDNPKIKIFHDKMKEVEAKIIDDAFTNRLAWFKDDFDNNKAMLAKLFTPMVRVDKDPKTGKPVGKYPATLKAKLPYDNKSNTFTFEAYDMENNEISFQTIMNNLKGAKAQLIIQLTGLWFAGGKYGCSWKVISGKFQLHQYSKITFVDDSDAENVVADEESDDDDIVDSEVSKVLAVSAAVEKIQDDSEEEAEEEYDEEEEEAEQVEAEPEPEPEPVKPPPPVKKTEAAKEAPKKPVKKVVAK
jgi:hypothetical protein